MASRVWSSKIKTWYVDFFKTHKLRGFIVKLFQNSIQEIINGKKTVFANL